MITGTTAKPTVGLDGMVFRRAIEVIQTRGWTHGAWERTNTNGKGGAVCVMAAMGLALGKGARYFAGTYTTQDGRYFRFLNSILHGKFGLEGSASAVNWNDAGGRTVEEVINLLELAAERAPECTVV